MCHVPYFLGPSPSFSGFPVTFPLVPDHFRVFYDYVKETDGRNAECTEDGRDGRIGATEYAGENGTRKRGGGAERSEETGGDAERIT